VLESLNKMLKEQGQVQREIIKNAKGAALGLVAATKRRTKTSRSIGYVAIPKAAAGKLKIHLHLNRAALAKLAGKRSSVTLVVRIDMIVPSAYLHAGIPRSFVKRVTIKRAKRH